jgi:hypothetical protein
MNMRAVARRGACMAGNRLLDWACGTTLHPVARPTAR